MVTIRRAMVLFTLVVLPVSGLAPQSVARRFAGPDSALVTHRIKLGASTVLGIPSVGVERPLARAGRTFQWDAWREWLGKRAGAGKLAPRGFPASKRFRPR